MKPYIVLDTYYPPFWKAWKVGKDLTALTASLGLKPHYDPVHPAQDWCPWYDLDLHAEVKKRTTSSKAGEDWHQDGDTTPGSKMDCAIVMWCTNNPTQYRYDTSIYQPRPYEVVIARNLCGHHRRPPDTPHVRWIFRQRVEVPKHMELP